jgi:hypothetical protein
MRKSFGLLAAGLFIFLLAGNALACEQFSLNGTSWTGTVTTITSAGAETTSASFVINTITTGTPDTAFLYGTFTADTPTPASALAFSAIQEGNSLAITAIGFDISANISGYWGHHNHGGTQPSAVMTIRGRSLADGSMFEGTLTESTAPTSSPRR